LRPCHTRERTCTLGTKFLDQHATTARFHTRSGLLTASKDGEWINLDFPVEPAHQIEIDHELIDALGVAPCFVGKNGVDYIVQVESEEILKTMQPDFSKL